MHRGSIGASEGKGMPTDNFAKLAQGAIIVNARAKSNTAMYFKQWKKHNPDALFLQF